MKPNQTVRLEPVECVGCKRAKEKRGDMTPAHADHWKCSGCGQAYKSEAIVTEQGLSSMRVSFKIAVQFCPACGARFETSKDLTAIQRS